MTIGTERTVGAISWRRSLKTKIAAPFLLLLLAAVMLGTWGIRTAFESRLISQIESRGTAVGVVLGGAAEAMADLADLQRVVTVVGAEPDVSLILVVGGAERRVVASNRRGWIGQPLDRLPAEAHREQIESVLRAGQPIRNHANDRSAFIYSAPLVLPDAANLTSAANGVVSVHITTSAVQASAMDTARDATMAMVMGIMAVWGLLFLVVHRSVLRPMTAIQAALTRRRNNLEPMKLPMPSDDEIGLFAWSLQEGVDNLARQHAWLSSFHAITTDASATTDAKIRHLLELGLRTFGLDIAIVSRIRDEIYTVLHSAGTGAPAPGSQFPLKETYCRHAMEINDAVGVEHVGKSFFNTLPCYEKFRLEAYLGVPLMVGLQRYGTLNFSSPRPRTAPFHDTELAMIRLFSEWIGNELSRATTLENLSRSELSLRSIVDNVIDGIITVNFQGTIQTFNPAAEHIFGYRTSEVLGRNVNMLMPEPYHTAHDGYLRRYMETGEARIIGTGREVEGRRKDGSTFPLDLGVSEVKLEGERLFLGIIRDITERKRVERMQNEFISTVNHELRTPLTAIQGSLALIVKAAPEQLPDKYKRLLDIAFRNCGRLVRLINDILDMNKIQAGKMAFNLEQHDIMELVAQSVEANKAFADQFAVKIVVEQGTDGAFVSVDGDRILQVMTNLLSNAAKFSPEAGTVMVKALRTGGMVKVAVSDQGEGIPSEFQDRIFERFSQADSSTTRKREGTGLGLAISKAIVEQHGGRIGFETEPGLGTTFWFELPEPETDTRFPPVLICEDDADVADFIRAILEAEGVRCDVAATAEQAMTMLRETRYAMLTLDLLLPDRDGLSVLHDIRSNEGTRNLPVVVISAKADERRDELEGDALEVIDWLQKPLDTQDLLRAVQSLCERGGPTRPRVLYVEDARELREIVTEFLSDAVELITAGSVVAAREWLARSRFDLVLLDVGLPDGNGLDLLADLNNISTRPAPVILFTAADIPSNVARRVDAVLTKSRTSVEQLRDVVMGIIRTEKSVSSRPDA